MKRLLPWDEAEEIAFECEPGTINEGKLEILKDMRRLEARIAQLETRPAERT